MRFVMLATVFLAALPCRGLDLHVLPEAAGASDGSSWEHALPAAALADWLSGRLQPGDRLLLGSGEYSRLKMVIAARGQSGREIVIEGVDRGGGQPLITGVWSEHQPDKGSIAVEFTPSAAHLTLRGLRFRDHQTAVLAPGSKDGAARSGLRFENLDITRVRHGFYLSDCHDLVLENCRVRRCTKHAFRFESGCEKVTVQRCEADCSEGDPAWEKLTESLPFGFFVNGSPRANRGFTFAACTARNHLMPHQKSRYKNGDGFVVEDTTSGVAFHRCRAFRNQDAGFDIKPPGVVFKNCIASGNSRNFRLWSNATLENCFSGFASTGLWSNGGIVEIKRCTFFALNNAAVQTDDHATGPVTLSDCLIGQTETIHRRTARGICVVGEDCVHDPAPGAPALRLTAPDPTWQGDSDAMNSAAYPKKGFRFEPDQKPGPGGR